MMGLAGSRNGLGRNTSEKAGRMKCLPLSIIFGRPATLGLESIEKSELVGTDYDWTFGVGQLSKPLSFQAKEIQTVRSTPFCEAKAKQMAEYTV